VKTSRNDKLHGTISLGLKWNNCRKTSFRCHCFWDLQCAAEMELGLQFTGSATVAGSGQCVTPSVWRGFE